MSYIKVQINNPCKCPAIQKEVDKLQVILDAKAEKINQKAAKLAAKAARESAAKAAAMRKQIDRKHYIIGDALLAGAKDDASTKAALDLLMKSLDATETNEYNRKALGLKPLSEKNANDNTLEVIYRGQKLSQSQLDALIPVLNKYMHGEIK